MKKFYDFYCNNCEKEYEAFTKETTSTTCPHCGSNYTERRPSVSHFKVTGQGAYSTKMKVTND